LPLVALCCLELILFAIAATIVLPLIPVYLKTRGHVSGKMSDVLKKLIDIIYELNICLSIFICIITTAGSHSLIKTLAAGLLNKSRVTTVVPSSTSRRQIYDGSSSPLAVNQH
jgi:hypothetical protein